VKTAVQQAGIGAVVRSRALATLLQRFPNDVVVHRTYQSVARHVPDKGPEAVVDEYRSLLEKHPNDPMYSYLAANALVGYRTKEAIPQLERMDFPWAHYSLAEIYKAPAFKDREKASRHLQALMTACPESLEPFALLRDIEPSDFLRESAQKLRRLLEKRTDAEAAAAYVTLWPVEFKLRPLAEHVEVRRQVAEDVKKLRAADPGSGLEYAQALMDGYKLLGDSENIKWAEQQVTARAPAGSRGLFAYSAWSKANPAPKPDDPPEKHPAYYEALRKASAEWTRQLPGEVIPLEHLVRALKQLERTNPKEVVAAGEALLAFRDRFPGPETPLSVAELYAGKGIETAKAAALAREGAAELQKAKGVVVSDLYPRAFDPEYSNQSFLFSRWSKIADIWLKLKNPEEARLAVSRLNVLLRKLAPSGTSVDEKDQTESMKKSNYPVQESGYWQKNAELALLENRKLDAMTFYQNALSARPEPASKTGDELFTKARALWKVMGGSGEAWQAWYTRRRSGAPGAVTWTTMNRPFPEFKLADLRGIQWTLQNLKGKTAFVNVWASW
jgi:hypothetical protein